MMPVDNYANFREWAESSKLLVRGAYNRRTYASYADSYVDSILKDLNEVCNQVRAKLADQFDVVSRTSVHYKYVGLCDRAAREFRTAFAEARKEDEYAGTFIALEDPLLMHGEMKHCKDIPSLHWTFEHTIIMIPLKKSTQKVFIDITRDQIDYILDITEDTNQYTTASMPDYFLPDLMNPKFNNRFLYWLNYNCFSLRYHGSKIGIYDYFEYIIKGKLYDFLFHHKKGDVNE